MKVPIPCKFGDYAECNHKKLQFVGVDCFKWSRGIEYTYFFGTGTVDFYTTFSNIQPVALCIPDKLFVDGFIKEKGYPLKGKGYANGIRYKAGILYIDFLMTGNYFEHIKVQCDKNWEYIPNGDIIFPPCWSIEKQENAVLKSMRLVKGKSLVDNNCKQQPKKLTIFDFINKWHI